MVSVTLTGGYFCWDHGKEYKVFHCSGWFLMPVVIYDIAWRRSGYGLTEVKWWEKPNWWRHEVFPHQTASINTWPSLQRAQLWFDDRFMSTMVTLREERFQEDIWQPGSTKLPNLQVISVGKWKNHNSDLPLMTSRIVSWVIQKITDFAQSLAACLASSQTHIWVSLRPSELHLCL